MESRDFERAILDHNGVIAELESPFKNDSNFKKNGYICEKYSDNINKDMLKFFDNTLIDKFKQSDYSDDFYCGVKKDAFKIVEQLNNQYIYFGPPHHNSEASNALKSLLESIREKIENEMGSYFEVINVRSWKTTNNAIYGPNTLHSDGGSFFIRKIMIYPYGINRERGGIEIIDYDKRKINFDISKPVWVLLNSSQILHKGLSASCPNFHRPVIEITIKNSKKTNINLVFSGQNARMPKDNLKNLPKWIPYINTIEADKLNIKRKKNLLDIVKFIVLNSLNGKIIKIIYSKILREYFKRFINKFFKNKNKIKNYSTPELNLNIGAGRITHSEFRNLDVVSSKTNPYPFIFSKDCIFPISSNTIRIVYTSHFLEHIDNETVDRVISESFRVLRPNGKLVIKIPDFELILSELKKNNAGFFKKQNVEWSWINKNVPISWQNIALMWFCGFWNKAYGSHFKRDIRKNKSAYHGPPVSGLRYIDKIKNMRSPHEISLLLRNLVIQEETDFEFNHQNSWSKSELKKLLTEHDLKVISFNKDEIIKKFKSLPKIEELKELSIYCYAKKS